MSPETTDQRHVYLFSSNSQPQYAQNVLDVIAAPPGAVLQWRYEERWVSEEFAEAVRDGTIRGLPVVLHFSLQQRAQLQEPALLPIRTGRIVNARILGRGVFIVWVRIVDDAGLGWTGAGAADSDEMDRGARRYGELLDERSIPRPYGASASIGAPLPSGQALATGDRTSGLFENNVKWLAQTETFRSARFFRFYRLVEQGGKGELKLDEEGRLKLRAGRSYELELFLFQPDSVEEPSTFEVFTDETAVSVVGRRTFSVASSYDLVRVRLAIQLPAEMKELDTTLVVMPQEGTQGPNLELPLRVVAARLDRMATVGGSALTLLLLAAQALVESGPVKVGLLAVAVLLGTFLAWRNRPIAPLAGGIRGSSQVQVPAPANPPADARHSPHAASPSA